MWHWVPTPGAQYLFQPATAVFTGCALLLAVGLGPRSPDCRGLETLPGPLPPAPHGCGTWLRSSRADTNELAKRRSVSVCLSNSCNSWPNVRQTLCLAH